MEKSMEKRTTIIATIATIAVILLLSINPVVARADTPDDYGNTFSDASIWDPIHESAANSKNAAIDYSKDVDMFKFTAAASGTYTFSTGNLAPTIVYLDLYLYNSSYGLISGKLANNNQTVSFNCSLNSGQTYYLKADGYMGTGAYTVNISG